MNKLRIMMRIRLFEERVSSLRKEIKGPLHTCIGQEAVSAGVCLALDKSDYIIGNHRSHGHLIAKGADVNLLMAEIFRKSIGTNGGRGGSMHVSDVSVGAICSTAIVGSGLPLACGVAFASKYKKDGRVTCVFFGDGATNEGTFYESINLASIWRLPVLFILENNGVAVTTLLNDVSTYDNLYLRSSPFDIYSQWIDGQDINKVFDATERAISRIRMYNQPSLIEAKTFRFHEHQEGFAYEKMKDTGYRDNEVVKYFIENEDPIKLYSEKLIKSKIIKQTEIDDIYSEETKLINDAVDFAMNSPLPEDAHKNIFV